MGDHYRIGDPDDDWDERTLAILRGPLARAAALRPPPPSSPRSFACLLGAD